MLRRSSGRLSRREFVIGSGAAVLASCGGGSGGSNTPGSNGGASADVKSISAGCWSPAYAGAGGASIGCGLLQSFGDPNFDTAFQQEIYIQQSFFSGFNPSVYILNECSDAQANSLSDPSGFLLIGYYCVLKVISKTGDAIAVAGILAHEWAHQVQFANGWMNTGAPTAAPVELEADAWSGIYMGYAKRWAGSELNAYLLGLASFGDWNFDSPSHHGTPNQRAAAGLLGLQIADYLVSNNMTVSYSDVHNVIVPQIQSILATVQGVAPQVSDKSTVQRLSPTLNWPANVLDAHLDKNFISDVALGKRSVVEFNVSGRKLPAPKASPLY